MQTGHLDIIGQPVHELIDHYIDQFEIAMTSGKSFEFHDFLPPKDHPDYAEIACELVRIDMEYGFVKNQRKHLSWYETNLPVLFENDQYRKAIEFELDRLSKIYPDHIGPEESTLTELPNESSEVGDYLEFSVIAEEYDSTSLAETNSNDSLVEAATLYQKLRNDSLQEGPVDLKSILKSNRLQDPRVDLFCQTCHSSPKLADKIASATLNMPSVGDRFLGFQLERSLGKGSFGQVFLARQGDLSNRHVALKITADIGGEAKNLAQLQHTNVIPVYSVHRFNQLRAVCMPYLGSATLADLVREVKDKPRPPSTWADLVNTSDLQHKSVFVGSTSTHSRNTELNTITPTVNGDSSNSFTDEVLQLHAPLFVNLRTAFGADSLNEVNFVSSILWIAKKIAEGLAHAHERGIIHRDLKPANVLFSNDGEPVLLDFNLSADIKSPVLSQLGGTLPYMAPEQLSGLHKKSLKIEPEADIYAVGVMLYEMLTGQLPFPVRSGRLKQILPLMVEDRLISPESPSLKNPFVSPATKAIIDRCLASNPEMRYSKAQDLVDDLECQLKNLPLKHIAEPSVRERSSKWVKRHPRLTSSTALFSVFSLFLLSLSGLYLSRERTVHKAQASLTSQNLLDNWPKIVAQLLKLNPSPEERAEGLELCKATLQPYLIQQDGTDWSNQRLIKDLPAMQQASLIRSISELLFLWSKTELDQSSQNRNISLSGEKLNHSKSLLELSLKGFKGQPVPHPVERLQARIESIQKTGADREVSAPPVPGPSEAKPVGVPLNTRDELLELADAQDGIDNQKAITLLRKLADQDSSAPFAWSLLGDAYARNGLIAHARESYNLSLALQNDQIWPRVNRGVLALERKDYDSAILDFEEVVKQRPDLATGWINLALSHLGKGNPKAALADLDRISPFSQIPTRVGFIRARCLEGLGQVKEALEMRTATLEKIPSDELSWIARGTEQLPGRPEAAISDFQSALKINPASLAALQNIAAVQSEYLGQNGLAIESLSSLIKNHPQYVPALASRGILLARKGDDQDALADAKQALKLDKSVHVCYQVAGIFATTSRTTPANADEAYQLLSEAFRADRKWIDLSLTDPDLAKIRTDVRFKKLIEASRLLHNPR